jgi:nitroimidazol reductase NimA-like FMN-containing flavoprotein (pyridoxamine 5'-phosphate oxidase superfamily)
MIEVRELGNNEIEELVSRIDYGHLACCVDDEPYVVPIHYAYDPPYIYVYTTEGKKSKILRQNPRVCLQIEDVRDNENWSSAILFGEAEQLTDETERAQAIEAVARINPTLTPAVSVRWMDNWVRENIEVVLRIVVLEMTGRTSVADGKSAIPFVSMRKTDSL